MSGNLVDELVLLTHPLALGSGRRLFSTTGSNLSAFQLTGSTTTGTGVIIATYQPAAS
jgi:riboflavin biosynthesis pyrimidine reductase